MRTTSLRLYTPSVPTADSATTTLRVPPPSGKCSSNYSYDSICEHSYSNISQSAAIFFFGTEIKLCTGPSVATSSRTMIMLEQLKAQQQQSASHCPVTAEMIGISRLTLIQYFRSMPAWDPMEFSLVRTLASDSDVETMQTHWHCSVPLRNQQCFQAAELFLNSQRGLA